MEVGQTATVHAAVQCPLVGREAHAHTLDDVAGTADRRGAIVAMLGHGQSGGGYDERGGGGDVERVATIATGAHDVDGRVVREVDGVAHLQEGVAEAAKLVHGDVAHEKNGDEGRRLGVVVAPLCDVL